MNLIRPVVIGAFAACAFVFPAAALLTLVYRFPVPFGGYQSGAGAVPAVLLGVMFYGATLGGFFLLAVTGAVAGGVAHAIRRKTTQSVLTLTLGLSLLVAFAAAFTLAILDKLIGPW